ncbi:MAG: hypothetical protein GX986_09960 [Firmicutes bacterium]|nr:hypothetical protein [Bacillota bacterium]
MFWRIGKLTSPSYSSPIKTDHAKVISTIDVRMLTILPLLIAIATLASGCLGNPGNAVSYTPTTPSGPTGGLAVQAVLAKGIGQTQEMGRVTATLTRGSHVIEHDLNIDHANMIASGTIPSVMIGTWELRVDVFSPQDELLYAGVTSIVVEEGRTTAAEVTLTTAPGELVVQLDLTEFAGHELIKGKLVFGTGTKPDLVKEFIRDQDYAATAVIKDLPPRTHDLKVEIYRNTYHSYNCIYEGPWQTVAIDPGKTTNLSWSPALGLVEVIGKIDLPPPSPTEINAIVDAESILITWASVTPPEDDLRGYRIYAQSDVYQGFELVAELPKTATAYYYQPRVDLGDGPLHFEFAVSSIDIGGHESARSPSVTVHWLGLDNF